MLSRPWSSILQPFIQGRRRLWLCPKKIERAVGAAPVPDSNPLSTTDTRVVRKNRSAGVSPASEPRQLLLGQHDLLPAGSRRYIFSHDQRLCGEVRSSGFSLLRAQVSLEAEI